MLKYVDVKDCRAGEVLAEDVIDNKGVMLLAKNAVLNNYILSRLQDFRVEKIAVYASDSFQEMQKITPEEFKKDYKNNLCTVKRILNDLAAGVKPDYQEIASVADFIYENRYGSYGLIECINELRSADEYTYIHSINTGIYSSLIARWLNLEEQQIKEMVMAGMLHDIGKAKIPNIILNKKGKLSEREFEIIKKHTIVGYQMSKSIPNLKFDVRKAILMHHEREDGSGYPLGVKGNKINVYAKIVAVGDVYDALTSERAYKKKTTPFDTFEEFQRCGVGLFDPKVMLTFLTNISHYYISSKVRMNTGEIGEIVYVPPHNISKPVIRLEGKIIDLEKERDYSISEMLGSP